MSDLRTAAQHALEAMDELHRTGDTQVFDMCHKKTTEALRAALAEPVQEPVGQLLEQALFGRGQVMWFSKPADGAMLYAAPPQRKPLTEEEIQQCFKEAGITIVGEAWTKAIRAIERAHGIGDSNE